MFNGKRFTIDTVNKNTNTKVSTDIQVKEDISTIDAMLHKYKQSSKFSKIKGFLPLIINIIKELYNKYNRI